MNTSALLHSALPNAAAIVIFILALRVYLKRRGFPFLLLACGFGIGALLATSALIAFFGGPSLTGLLEKQIPSIWIAISFGAPLLFILGFYLLGRTGSTGE